ncbi:SGNH/GDSL hydrolase family protein [Duganella sp. FT92W]|uniref:SGNH/GDSL hydrolase family protein n=1 Tax=Pseudoduganella rivuli TaxID=2666085 RepID=A0A7X2IPZ4_9BURK|nr:SGNH/GDSL hydrolase family protein [Pseudoduganella rivuli]MRV73642.1 SGNH/GDSL hydrolase family protein [Pseudoduganella rivuli]
MQLKKWSIATLSLLAMHGAIAGHAQETKLSELPLLVIGASYSEAKTPFNNGIAPQGGRAVNFGNYLSLGAALTRDHQLPGYVINEAQAGAGTFTRFQCPPGAATCSAAVWDSFQVQLQRALTRVALPPPAAAGTYNAKYVVITIANDCLHAGGMGVPQPTSVPCTLADMNATADRLVALGNFALSKGLIPIFTSYPKYEDLDFPLFKTSSNVAWVIDEQGYQTLRDLVESRLEAELPGAILLDIWKEFTHIGDGLHPDPDSTRKAAHEIAKHLRQLDH